MKNKFKAYIRVFSRALQLVWSAAPGWTAVSLGFVVVQSGLPLVVLYFTKITLDSVAAGYQHGDSVVSAATTRAVLLTAVAMWIGLIVRSLAAHATEIQGDKVSEHVQSLIAAKAIAVDLSYYENAAYFDTLHQAQHEAPYRLARLVGILVQIAQSIFSMLTVAGLLLIVFRWTIVLVVVAVGVLGLLAQVGNVRLLYRWRKSRASSERQLNYYNWMLGSAARAKEIRLLGLGTLFAERARDLRRGLRTGRMKIVARQLWTELATQTCATAGVAAAFFWLVRRTVEHVLTIGDLVMNLQAIQRGTNAVQDLIKGSSQLYENGLFINHLFEFLALPQRTIDPDLGLPFPTSLQQGIRFEGVTFSYLGTGRPVLDRLDMHIEPGQMVALVGENGAGKSTLIKLLCRLYEPQQGRITIDGRDLAEYKRADLWRHLSPLLQDYAQYQTSVAENIWLGAVDRDFEPGSIHAAAVMAGADPFITQLNGGYQQMLGSLFEGGVELSGGQWQKIALSRVFFKDAPLIILDEPSSALDVTSEHDLFARFKQISEGKTSIVITHRLSTVRMADRIFYLENGRVAEVGSHEELVALKGAYSDLFSIQAGSYQ